MTIRMTVSPIPILILLPVIQRRVFPVFLVLFPKIYAVGAVFVVIPAVVVLVRAVVNACLFFIVSVIVLRRCARSNRGGCGQCGAEKKKTYVSVSGFHFVLLLAKKSNSGFSAGASMPATYYRRCKIRDTFAARQNRPIFPSSMSLASKNICAIEPYRGHSACRARTTRLFLFPSQPACTFWP